jgi:hypothetical protein
VSTPAQRFAWRRSLAQHLSWRISVMRRYPGLAALGLILLAAALTSMILYWPGNVPWAALLPVVVVAGMFLPPRWLEVVLLVIAGFLAFAAWSIEGVKPFFAGSVVVTAVLATMMLWLAVSRARLGVQGTLGESMLVDLRDRIRRHARLPALPEPWHAEVDVESAYGEPFSGDFAVSSLSDAGDRLEVVLVDVSGKGLDAGTRALLLSGAFGGLLGAM